MSFLLSKKNSKFADFFLYYIIPFTAGFLLLQFAVYYPFVKSNKSFIWDLDGINQHYPALVYYGRLLKNLIGGKDIPMVDFNLGMGFDVLTTLNYYAIGDPLTLLAAFVREDNMEVLYRFLIILRLYLSGISFLLYCIYREKKSYPSVLGAFIYVFCGYVFYAGTRHPYFTNPLIYLPLLFLGVEFILQKKKPYLFIITVFISAISNFYFFYMLTIIILIYGVVRFFYLHHKNSTERVWKLFFKTVVRTGLFYLLGVAMAAVILFPVLAAFFNNGRFNSGYQVGLLHYSPGYYLVLANSFIAPNISAGFWTQCTFAAIVPPAVLVAFRKREYRQLTAAFLIGTVSLMIPFIGYLMNGFSYVANRWEFGYSFLLAFMFTSVYEDIFRLKKADKILLAAGTFIYGALGLLNPGKYILYAFLILCATVFCILFFNRHKNLVYLQKTVIFIVVFINLGLNGYLTYSGRYGNYVAEFIGAGKAAKTIQNSAVSVVPEIQDDSFYRVEVYGDKQYNEGMTLGFHEVSGYFSIMDKKVSEYMKGLELVSQRATYRFDNLDYRTGLSTLAGVRYLVTPYKAVAPYGYELLKQQSGDGKTYYIYENRFALPLGYTYERYVTRDVYEALNPLQKQEIMLQAAVIEEPADKLKSIVRDKNGEGNTAGNQVRLISEELPITIGYGKGITQEGDYVNVTKPGAKLTVHFQGTVNSETYLRLEDFNINDSGYYDMNFKVKGEKEVTKTVKARSDRNNAYFGKDDYLINLGYQTDSMNYLVISFSKTGKFHLKGIQVYAMPMNDYEEQIRERKNEALENVELGNNRITGTLNSSRDTLLVLSIPYSKGWSAYVNGVKTGLLQANVMYMGLPLTAGSNKIELRYETPFLRAGIGVSAAGWLLFICFILFHRIKQVKKGNHS